MLTRLEQELLTALHAVRGSALVTNPDHDPDECEEYSCRIARVAIENAEARKAKVA